MSDTLAVILQILAQHGILPPSGRPDVTNGDAPSTGWRKQKSEILI